MLLPLTGSSVLVAPLPEETTRVDIVHFCVYNIVYEPVYRRCSDGDRNRPSDT